VDTGERPQNFIRDAGLAERFEEYPKQKELIKLKDEQVTNTNLPIKPMFIRSPLRTNDNSDYPLNDLIGAEFDVILGETKVWSFKLSESF
jgi:mRNA m6A methyltransferase non-catalytic subunit